MSETQVDNLSIRTSLTYYNESQILGLQIEFKIIHYIEVTHLTFCVSYCTEYSLQRL